MLGGAEFLGEQFERRRIHVEVRGSIGEMTAGIVECQHVPLPREDRVLRRLLESRDALHLVLEQTDTRTRQRAQPHVRGGRDTGGRFLGVRRAMAGARLATQLDACRKGAAQQDEAGVAARIAVVVPQIPV